MTIKYRFASFFSLVMAAFFFVFAIFIYFEVKNRLHLEAHQSLLGHLKHELFHLHESHKNLSEVKHHVPGVFIKVWKDEKLVYDNFPEGVTPDSTKENGNIFEVIREKRRGHQYEIWGVSDFQATLAYISTLRGVLALGIVLATLCTIPLSLWIVQYLLKPFRNLANITSNLGSENLSYRFPIPDKEDEFGILVRNFNSLLDRLDASFVYLNNFASHASHELKTPVSVVMSQADIALRRERSKEEYQKALRKILFQITGLNRLISHLLFLSDLKRLEGDCCKQPSQVAPLAGEIKEVLQRKYPASFDIESIATGLVYNGHREILYTVIINLVENALKHAKSRVSLSGNSDASNLWLRVNDDGPGISDDVKDLVWEPFYSKKRSSHFGIGLGLTLVRACIQVSRGKIWFETSELGGLCAIVQLPNSAPA